MSIVRKLVDKWVEHCGNERHFPNKMPTKLLFVCNLYIYLQTIAPIANFIRKLHLTGFFMSVARKLADRWLPLFYKEYPIYCDWPPEYYPEEGLDERWKNKDYDTN